MFHRDHQPGGILRSDTTGVRIMAQQCAGRFAKRPQRSTSTGENRVQRSLTLTLVDCCRKDVVDEAKLRRRDEVENPRPNRHTWAGGAAIALEDAEWKVLNREIRVGLLGTFHPRTEPRVMCLVETKAGHSMPS